jgi:site-specific recombinase XerD
MLRGLAIKTAAKRYFDENTTSVAATTRHKWGGDLRRLERRYPNKRLNELTSDDLRDWLLLDDDLQPRKVAPSTILANRTCLRSFFSWCEYAGLIPHDPSAVLTRTVKLKNRSVRRHNWLSEDEINSLFDICRADPNGPRGQRDAVALGLGLFCGLRVHEIAKASWADVNLRSGQLFVLGKGGKAATLPVPSQLVGMLDEWLVLTNKGLGRTVPVESTVLVSMRHLGSAIGTAGIRGMVVRRGIELGVPGLAPHDLRRSYAGILEDRGVPLRDISAVLRHSSIATTERYLADNPKKWQDSVGAAMLGLGMRNASATVAADGEALA